MLFGAKMILCAAALSAKLPASAHKTSFLLDNILFGPPLI
jgi:hypothetical protein